MELGIDGRTALICASSKGLGFACAKALAAAGATVVLNGRSQDSLSAAAKELSEYGNTVNTVVADVTDASGRAALLKACPEPDILVTNNGGPPTKPTNEIERSDVLLAIEMNMLAAIELIQAVVPSMSKRKFGRIVNITSAAVEMPLEGLTTSSVARSGLSAFTSALARQYANSNVTINDLEPGFFATDRVIALADAEKSEALSAMETQFGVSVPAGRLGDPEEFGTLCAYSSARSKWVI